MLEVHKAEPDNWCEEVIHNARRKLCMYYWVAHLAFANFFSPHCKTVILIDNHIQVAQ